MPSPLSSDLQDFVGQPHLAALSTVKPDGRPHVTPVWYDFDGSEFTIASFRNAQKLTNVTKKGFAALAIFTVEPPYQNVIVEGTARIGTTLDNVWRERQAMRYLGEHAGRVYVQESADIDFVAIHIRPLRWIPMGFSES